MIPPLSIVIPCGGRADLLRTCLDSVRRYAPAGSEIVVVDDGSPGAMVSRAAGTANIVRFERRRGFCAAANAGIRAAQAPVVELLNDDTEVRPGWAKAALDRFEEPNVVAVAPLVLNHANPKLIDSAGDDYDFGGFARKIGHRRPVRASDLQPRDVFGASGSSAFYRRDALVAAGGFPESFGAYFEDVDLSFRLRRLGGRIVYEPGSIVLHHGGSSYGRPARRLVERQSCNEERVFWRNLSPHELRCWLPRHLVVLAGKMVRRLDEGLLMPWLFGRLKAWTCVLADRAAWQDGHANRFDPSAQNRI